MAKRIQVTKAQRDDAARAVTFNRTERTLAFMAAGIGIAALLCIVAMIVLWLVAPSAGSSMPWPVVMAFPLIGLPIAMVLVFVTIGIVGARRARENRRNER